MMLLSIIKTMFFLKLNKIKHDASMIDVWLPCEALISARQQRGG